MDCICTTSWKETVPHRASQALPTHVTAYGRGTLEQMQVRRAGSLANTMCNMLNLRWIAMQQWRNGAMGSTKSGAPLTNIITGCCGATSQKWLRHMRCSMRPCAWLLAQPRYQHALLNRNKHLCFPQVDLDAGVRKVQQLTTTTTPAVLWVHPPSAQLSTIITTNVMLLTNSLCMPSNLANPSAWYNQCVGARKTLKGAGYNRWGYYNA